MTFDQAIQQPYRFDFDLDEFSITKPREQVVDFSAPYYNVSQAVVTVKGTKAASVTTLAGLKSLKLGVQVGTTAYDSRHRDDQAVAATGRLQQQLRCDCRR